MGGGDDKLAPFMTTMRNWIRLRDRPGSGFLPPGLSLSTLAP